MPPAQIFIDAVGNTGGKLLLLIAIGAQLFCGMSSVTANSRMIYAFSRDGALPGAAFWHRVNKRTRTPTNAIWLAAGFAFILGLPYLKNYTAYAAVTSIAVIGLYIAYVLPTFLRLRQGEDFQRGPWHLGRWSYIVGWIAVIWVVIITILFMLPQASPITWLTFNYAPIAVAVVLGFAWIYWAVSAKNWFTGPKVQGTAEELAAIEHELEAPIETDQIGRFMTDSHGSGGAPRNQHRQAGNDEHGPAAGGGRCGRDRHGDARLHRHAGPAARASACRRSTSSTRWPSTTRRAATTCSRWTWT